MNNPTRKNAMLRLLLAASLLIALPILEARAELVGYQFAGTFTGSSTGTYSLFGINVPRNSPVTGTFSYDTNSVGVDVETGKRTFQQDISGGYTLNINNGAIRLSASDYVVTVGNDLARGPATIDMFSVDFDQTSMPAPTPILVNGTPWTGAVGFIKIEYTWAPETFDGEDEPKLTSNRAETPDSSYEAFVGSALTGTGGLVRYFGRSEPPSSPLQLSPIAPQTGDYNHDGVIDASDWNEWRRTFGATAPLLHADGNSDGIVDASDYVTWRRAMGQANASSLEPSNVPEPMALVLVSIALLLLPIRLRVGRCCD